MAYEMFIADAVFWAASGFLVGILAAALDWNLLIVVAWALFGVAAVLAVAMVLKVREIGEIAAFFAFAAIGAISIAAFFFGAFYFHFHSDASVAARKLPPGSELGQAVSFSAIISEEPKMVKKWLVFAADMEPPYSGTLTVFAPTSGAATGNASANAGFQYGDELQMTGKILPPKMPGDNPVIFPSSKKMALIAAHRGFWLREKLLEVKRAILEKFNEALPRDAAALIGGETLGGAGDMSAGLKGDMSASGTAYVVSMYGYKISMILFFLEAALAGWVALRARFFILAGAVILFVMMAGGEPSVIRAAAMSLLLIVARAAGRVFDPRNALAFTAAGMAFADPPLASQAAFQMSFLSVAGIQYLAAPLQNFFGWDRDGARGTADARAADGIFAWREAVILSIASLLPIIPIIANAFGDFSLAAFPSNALISLAILPAMMGGAALAVCAAAASYAAIFHFLEFLIVQLVSAVLVYQFAIIKIFAAIRAPLPLAFDSAPALVIYYGALAWFARL